MSQERNNMRCERINNFLGGNKMSKKTNLKTLTILVILIFIFGLPATTKAYTLTVDEGGVL